MSFPLFCLAQVAKNYTVGLNATIQNNPFAHQISWPADTGAKEYRVYYKQPNDISWVQLAVLDKYKTNYTNTIVKEGQITEYRVIKFNPTYNAYGYISVGSKVDEYNERGVLLLLIDSNYNQPLATEIKQLQNDLIGDGWQIVTRYIPRSYSPPQVKQHVYDVWQQYQSNFKAVYLLGRVAVPYSGYVGPDGHGDHYGAWPADVYYSVIDSTQWTDNVLNVKVSSDPRNYNTPLDGKFDADIIVPGSAKLEWGRVDLTNMPAFGNDTMLTRRYLTKAHNYKINKYAIPQKGLIDDNIGAFYGEAFVRGGWSSFPTMFGDSVIEGDFVTDLKAKPFMFAATAGFGNYTTSSGVVAVGNLVADSFSCPFTSYFGSYFGDWDNTNNLLRATIASRSLILTSIWSGRPVAYHHQMALGQTIGYTAKMAINSPRSLYHSEFVNNGIHLALMGDPSLRLHPITPASGFTASANCQQVNLSWTASTDTAITEYRVYRSQTQDGKYELAGKTTGNTYIDTTALLGTNYYMIRAVRLQKTPSGTYYNMSLGQMDSAYFSPAPKPVIMLSDSVQCASGNKFIIKSGIKNYPNPYNQSWRVNGQTEPFTDSLVKTFSVEGTHFISCAVSTPGCYDSTGVSLKVHTNPSSPIVYTQLGQCQDSNEIRLTTNAIGVNYVWAFSDGDTVRVQNPSKSFNTSGTFSVSLVTENATTGCKSAVSNQNFTILPKPSPINIQGNKFLQLGRPQTYTVSGPVTSNYTWAVSTTPDFMNAKNDSLQVRWDNQLLAARINVVERDDNGCKGDTAYMDVWTIINSVQETDKKISVYPVPTSGNELFIYNHNTGIDIAQLLVTDVSGKTIINTPIQLQSGDNTLDISQLSGGIYYLTVSWGQYTSTHKIMKLE